MDYLILYVRTTLGQFVGTVHVDDKGKWTEWHLLTPLGESFTLLEPAEVILFSGLMPSPLSPSGTLAPAMGYSLRMMPFDQIRIMGSMPNMAISTLQPTEELYKMYMENKAKNKKGGRSNA